MGFLNFEFQIYKLLMGLVYYIELVNWFYAVKHAEVSLGRIITTPNPLLTMIFALFILIEPVEIYQIIMMIMVFISLYGLLRSGNKATKKTN